MNLRTFIERPVLSAVISITIVVVGIIGLFTLPVEQYPDIAPPTIMVSTSYFGASAETLQKSVIAPLEEAINGVEDMTYMTSSATNAGTVSITVYFKQGTDPDMAAVNVQNRVSKATGQLPSEVNQVGVTTSKRQTSILQMFSLHSPDDSYDEAFLANYISINLKPEILRISGVGDMMIMGGDYSLRIWMKPDVMAQYRLIPSDVSAVLAEQNIESATGSFGENSDETYQYTMKYKGRRITPEEFGEIVIRSTDDGQVLKLKDIATIELGQESYAYSGTTDGHNGISCMLFQTAGSNATEVNNRINDFLEEARKDLPRGVELTQLMSSNDFLYASIHEVVKTLLEAILLVILVVYIFLQDIRSTLIPLVGIIVSLVGTFAFMAMAGFSINLITLFALVLVIGTVVDDAIVVVEAVQARFDVGYKSSYMASIDAMKGISNAVITSSLVFMAVFIPVSFMSGTSGTFYTQFGLTMAVAVGISAVNALTLSPALCALLLKPYINEDGTQKQNFAARFRKAFNAAFDVVIDRYKGIVLFFIKHRWLTGGLLVASIALLVVLMNTTKTSLVPDEDQGVVFVNVSTAAGSSLRTTDEVMKRIEQRMEQIPQVEHVQKVAGYGLLAGQGSSFGMLILKLKPWDERPGKEDNVQSVIGQVYGRTGDIKDATVFAISPGMIPGYGMGNALELHMQDKTGGDVNTFFQTTQQYLGALNQRPEIAMAYSTFDVRYPQWLVEIDPSKCKRSGITPDQVLSTLSGYYGGQYVSNFNRFSKVYKVMIQSDPQYRLDEASLGNTFVRMSNGEMAPLSQFATLTRTYGAESLSRFNMYNSIAVNAMPADGYSTGDAIRAVQETASTALPKGYGYDYGGITREETEQSGTTAIIFGICFLMIYLILSALYESFLIPFAVLLSVPCGLMGSFLFARLFGLENNIYLQTGLIMLIGLLAKTAILLTEYAAERRKAGMGLIASALSAAKARLRPILMTALTMIFGLFPLMVASGVGANGNRSLGTGAVGGMVIGTLALLFIVPSLFIAFQWLQERIRPIQTEPTHDWQIEEEIAVSDREKKEAKGGALKE
ncbi:MULTISPECIES: efflux RND transporter permease subunit [Bacteroides]|jgi:hydrophobe/amphiphile efflux-1 (HAE1) family protein|uniref:Hydrophobe/amphiphile efflux-1 family RND transporter n=1 Tax=Bacteroides fragilis TaxID=817 RepID=A0A413K2F9_BACFG|nr:MULTISPECIES: efflux RND transporter permease subunit [Bacteroides]EKA79846.1 hydrophobe/amphiphile efflux-1 (HAE1) family RND transporter [Bacteroides fragilis HMW 616]MBU3041177.1 efflux RND transporter permease subunit [Bacteroides sp. HF-4919]MBY2894756.1 multidrug transporter AcrB [Bacteroides fragilis]MCE8633257.1 efflux RND transporter permease subunit [Bacteroides fragilis]MCE8682832.1 efflux RND transporter permease subunit [Bacteroides fragilis]